MRISFAANHAEIGGGEVMLLAMAQAAIESGHTAEVVAPAGEVAAQAQARGHRTVIIGGTEPLGYLRGLRAWARSERPQLLWCTGLRAAVATAGIPRRVVHLHSLPSPLLRAALPAVTRRALRVMVPSEWLRERLHRTRLTVLPNWTRDLSYTPHLPTAAPGDLRIGFLGRLTADKGILVLLDALERLSDTRAGRFRLVVGGVARFGGEADSARIAGRLANRADRLGWVDPGTFFNSVDLAVVPSVTAESFGLVAAEAMAAGCPFVISTAGALPEVTGHPAAFTARPGDPEDLARAITAAVTRYTVDDLHESRRRWEELYSPDSGRARWVQIMKSLEAG